MSNYKWVPYRNAGSDGRVTVGRDADGAVLAVARARHNGETLPAKAKPEQGLAYVTYNGTEHIKKDFDLLLINKYRWVSTEGKEVPSGAVEGGKTSGGEPLYIGKTSHAGAPTIGKVHPSHGCLFVPYGGKEYNYLKYDVLVQE